MFWFVRFNIYILFLSRRSKFNQFVYKTIDKNQFLHGLKKELSLYSNNSNRHLIETVYASCRKLEPQERAKPETKLQKCYFLEYQMKT